MCTTGQYTLAKLTALELRAQLPLFSTFSTSTGVFDEMIDFLEMFLAVPIHVMVRFGRWTDILCEPLPPGAAVSQSDLHVSSAALFRLIGAIRCAATG